MADFVPWLREMAEQGGKGVVNNIDARCLGRIANELERLRSIAVERMDLFRQAASKVEEADALLLAFVAAYEQQDASNFTDAMRNVYAAADLFVSGDAVGDVRD
jgi:coenzyme F420-reducing hydrogenase alpha subunit